MEQQDRNWSLRQLGTLTDLRMLTSSPGHSLHLLVPGLVFVTTGILQKGRQGIEETSILVLHSLSRTIIGARWACSQFINFKLHTVLSSVMKSRIVLLPPTQDVKHSSVQRMLPVSHLVAVWVIKSTVLVSQCLCSINPYFT